MQYELVQIDAVHWARRYAARIKCGEDLPLFHALLCDPPYELKFMGRDWDSTGISFRPETWRAFKRILLPGAFGMAFSSARGFHRMAVAIEDAGFVIHPMIGWVYGSGFPKATRLDTQIDKQANATRETIGRRKHPTLKDSSKVERQGQHQFHASNPLADEWDLTAPATDLAKSWQGHRYGLQALKPALEPIIVFQKPYQGKPLDQIVQTGAGALNIDAGRIKTDPNVDDKRLGGQGDWSSEKMAKNVYEGGYSGERVGSHESGRWPANFVITHHPDCKVVGELNDNYQINRFTDGAKPFGDGAGQDFTSNDVEGKSLVWECAEGCPARAINEQSGHLKSGKFESHHKIRSEFGYHGGQRAEEPQSATYGDRGGAARFFHQSEWALEQSDPILYQAKAAKSERNAGLDNIEYILITFTSWEKEESQVLLLVDMELLVLKAIDVYGISIKNDIEWSMSLFGKALMELFQRECKFTISTEKDLTIESKILNWLLHFIIKESTQVATLEEMFGLNHVSIVKATKKSMPKIGISLKRDGLNTIDVKNVILKSLLLKSASVEIEIKNKGQSTHPTVKPIALTRHLASLLLPPDHYAPRNLFIPFAGVASEMIGALQTGWDNLIGVELESEYVQIGLARMKYWIERGFQPNLMEVE